LLTAPVAPTLHVHTKHKLTPLKHGAR